MPPLPRRAPEPAVLVREYGCCLCQKLGCPRYWHREGIDHEYAEHLGHQSEHGPRRRVATAAERLALAVGALEFGGEGHP